VWERTVDGRVLSFRLAGINNQNFIMQDRETGSWWQQVSGKAILGPLKGKALERVFHDELTFAEWKKEAPGGRVLVPAADSAWRTFSDGWEAKTALEPVRLPGPLDSRLPARTIILGIEAGGSDKAYPLDRVLAQAPLHDRVGTVPLVLLVGPDGKSVRAFDVRLDTMELELVRPVEGSVGMVVDVGTGSHWSFTGEAVSGPLEGRKLTPVYLLKDYWFDWVNYHPNTGLYLLGAGNPGPQIP
jgi:hypothetical protein